MFGKKNKNKPCGFKKALFRHLRVLYFITGSGAALVLLSVCILFVNDAWEQTAKTIGLLGVKWMVGGYPAYLIFLLLKHWIKGIFKKSAKEKT